MTGATADQIIKQVQEMSEGVRARAVEVEQGRRLPTDLLAELAESQCLRLLVPADVGGADLEMQDALRILEILGRAEGSVGWTVGQVTLAQLVFGCFSPTTRAKIYATGPDTLGSGAVAPKGRATGQRDGWRVSGQWPYVTGCWYSTWTYLTCVVVDGHSVRIGPDGVPSTCMVVLPTRELEIIDTWNVLGLRGTASHDVLVSGKICDRQDTLFLDPDNPETVGVRTRIAQAGLLIAAVSLGIAQGALDDIVALATRGKRPAFSRASLAESTLFQARLGQAQVTCAAARAVLHSADAMPPSTMGVPGPLERATVRAVVAQVIAMCTQVVDTAHSLAGGSSAYESSPLPRRLRDMHTASQHFVGSHDHYATLGAVLAGASYDPSRI